MVALNVQGEDQLVALFMAGYIAQLFVKLVHFLQQHVDLFVGQKTLLFNIQDAKSFGFVVHPRLFLHVRNGLLLGLEEQIVEAQHNVQQAPHHEHQEHVEVRHKEAVVDQGGHHWSRPVGTVQHHRHVPQGHAVVSKRSLAFVLLGVEDHHAQGRVNHHKGGHADHQKRKFRHRADQKTQTIVVLQFGQQDQKPFNGAATHGRKILTDEDKVRKVKDGFHEQDRNRDVDLISVTGVALVTQLQPDTDPAYQQGEEDQHVRLGVAQIGELP
mmetsp:Transcript_62491/g.110228  ORF Transcript_62491/g.110228 Transcript_62491/m.110228 type:complete len:270 (-) Transcript_62491:640-1449(-)